MALTRPTRVLIVEDSPVMQRLLERAINSDPRLSVVGVAGDADQALSLLRSARPDVVSMDIRLPRVNGLELTRIIMREYPLPIVVVAADVDDSTLAISMNALKAGALTVVEKPKGTAQTNWNDVSHQLCTQLYIMSKVKVVRQRNKEQKNSAASRPISFLQQPGGFQVVGIGASTGGPGSLANVLGFLLPAFPLPILVVQHIGAPFVEGFAHWLSSVVSLPVEMAAAGESLTPGRIYVAPANRHLLAERGKIILRDGSSRGGQKPAVDRLFESLAASYGEAAIGILLTGMGEDGARGLLALREAGGYTIAEDESTAVVWGMPGSAVRLGAAVEQLPAALIGRRIWALATSAQTTSAQKGVDMSKTVSALIVSASPVVSMRLRLILDAEGVEVSVVDRSDVVEAEVARCRPALIVVDGSTIADAPPEPGIRRMDLGHDPNWPSVARRIRYMLKPFVSEADELASALNGARILLVDDSATYREYLRLELEREGAAVKLVKGGEEALACLTEQTFDCLLVDLVMPGMDGAEICRRAARLRREQGQTLVLVVVVSSRENFSDIIRSLEAGADDFIGKSQDMTLFKVKLSAALRRKFLMDVARC